MTSLWHPAGPNEALRTGRRHDVAYPSHSAALGRPGRQHCAAIGSLQEKQERNGETAYPSSYSTSGV
jgi:hypothetical protein